MCKWDFTKNSSKIVMIEFSAHEHIVSHHGTFHYYISIERKFHKESNLFVEKKFRPFIFEKIVLGKVSLYHLETPIRKFCFTSPLGIKTLYPSSSVDMVLPVLNILKNPTRF